MEQFIDLIKDDMKKVEQEFHQRLASQVPRLTEVAQDLLNRGGKRFRPALLILSARLCRYKGTDHIPLAAVIEFIHTATLLHDDVIDNAEVRRGRPSANRQVGNRYSVLTGDFLFCKSLAMGIAIGNLRILQTLIAATTALSEGEAMEMEQTGESERLVLLPADPDASARAIQSRLESLSGIKLAVLIIDTLGRPFREGVMGMAIGVAGMDPLIDMRGQTDIFGYVMERTIINRADEIAAAASMLMGQTTARLPVVIVRGATYWPGAGSSRGILREPWKDMFRPKEYLRSGKAK